MAHASGSIRPEGRAVRRSPKVGPPKGGRFPAAASASALGLRRDMLEKTQFDQFYVDEKMPMIYMHQVKSNGVAKAQSGKKFYGVLSSSRVGVRY